MPTGARSAVCARQQDEARDLLDEALPGGKRYPLTSITYCSYRRQTDATVIAWSKLLDAMLYVIQARARTDQLMSRSYPHLEMNETV